MTVREQEALRDQFAAAALTGLLASLADNAGRQVVEEQAAKRSLTPMNFIADLAYNCADAMMARRAQPTADAPAPSTAQTAPSA